MLYNSHSRILPGRQDFDVTGILPEFTVASEDCGSAQHGTIRVTKGLRVLPHKQTNFYDQEGDGYE